LAKQPAKRGVLQPFALNLLETRIMVAECRIREAERDGPVPEAESELPELVAKLAMYHPALHDARVAR
jgi:hypothetical protein